MQHKNVHDISREKLVKMQGHVTEFIAIAQYRLILYKPNLAHNQEIVQKSQFE
jgi:hypothetical protein